MGAVPNTDRTLMPHETALTLYVIYDHPLDFPRNVVVRPWDILQRDAVPRDVCALFPSIDEARQWCLGLQRACVGRMGNEDPKVVEVWV